MLQVPGPEDLEGLLVPPATVPVSTVDMQEVGRVMATLDDWRTIVYAMLVIFAIMVLERAAAAWGMRNERRDMRAEREKMWEVADKFGEAAKEYTSATDKVVVELQVLRALAARVESATDAAAAHGGAS